VVVVTVVRRVEVGVARADVVDGLLGLVGTRVARRVGGHRPER
jgi:hypothetical protein